MELFIYCFGLIGFGILFIIFADDIDKQLSKLLEPTIRATQEQLMELKNRLERLYELEKDIDKQVEELYNILTEIEVEHGTKSSN